VRHFWREADWQDCRGWLDASELTVRVDGRAFTMASSVETIPGAGLAATLQTRQGSDYPAVVSRSDQTLSHGSVTCFTRRNTGGADLACPGWQEKAVAIAGLQCEGRRRCPKLKEWLEVACM